MSSFTLQRESPWPHRLAVLLVCATFPLIWVGGLVTTYNAGMAVPDWPTTFGYNLFLYPWETWVYGPWDLFIEHGHRLLGAAVGMITIALVVAVWRCDSRSWMRVVSVAALAGVVLQGVLGGMRVRLDERLLAQIHGCVGPAFFALSVALAVFTSRRWREGLGTSTAPVDSKLPRLAVLTTIFAYVQLILGSQLRHVRPDIDPTAFRVSVLFHLVMALVVTVHVVLASSRVFRLHHDAASLVWPAAILLLLIVAQLLLGVAAWAVNYGWPQWLPQFDWTDRLVIVQEGQAQATLTTAHVAGGSLILAFSTVLSLRSLRDWRLSGVGQPKTRLALGAAR